MWVALPCCCAAAARPPALPQAGPCARGTLSPEPCRLQAAGTGMLLPLSPGTPLLLLLLLGGGGSFWCAAAGLPDPPSLSNDHLERPPLTISSAPPPSPPPRVMQCVIWYHSWQRLKGEGPAAAAAATGFHAGMAIQAVLLVALALLAGCGGGGSSGRGGGAPPSSPSCWRPTLAVTMRLLLYLPPHSRTLIGSPQALQRSAMPGVWGAVSDLWRFILGGSAAAGWLVCGGPAAAVRCVVGPQPQSIATAAVLVLRSGRWSLLDLWAAAPAACSCF